MFWQTPRVRKQARPQVRTPTALAAGVIELEVVVDAHERYAYRFDRQADRTVSRALPCGDYGIVVDGRLDAAVERESLADLARSRPLGTAGRSLDDTAVSDRGRPGHLHEHKRGRPRRQRSRRRSCGASARRPRWSSIDDATAPMIATPHRARGGRPLDSSPCGCGPGSKGLAMGPIRDLWPF